ncbi:hypothetical protein A6302_02255 [Methylobrevis pamukkalensis]|uniref:Uncharacterized protein n=2 Tax=Methylobrevis pamukkalensis TaxID=1439726 RepID=A0A1E3H2B5_9HYPH|nr:hypothetical protein A6302_02255 [Methylobrevis pamukkalensis]
MYGVEQFSGNEDHYLKMFKKNNKSVKKYFAGRPDDLLVMDLSKKDGWLELVNFLGKDFLPAFPHKNVGVVGRGGKKGANLNKVSKMSKVSRRIAA